MVGETKGIHHRRENETPDSEKESGRGRGRRPILVLAMRFCQNEAGEVNEEREGNRTRGRMDGARGGRRNGIDERTYHGWRHRFLGDLPFSFPGRCFG